MTIQIVHEDGTKLNLEPIQIQSDIQKAAESVGSYPLEFPKQITDKVLAEISTKPSLSMSELEEIIELLLMREAPKVAKIYILQRHTLRTIAKKVQFRDNQQPGSTLQQIVKRNGSVVSFDQQKITIAIHKAAGSVGIHDKALCEQLSNEIVWYIEQGYPKDKGQIPTVEEIQDVVEEVLIKHDLAAIAKAYILYRDYRARIRQSGKRNALSAPDFTPYKKIWEILSWNTDHECETVEKFNQHIRTGTIGNLIQEADACYHEQVAGAAAAILEQKDQIRLVIIAGPSSSGKTTTTIKLAEHLRNQGIKLIALNIDNYFFNLECHPKDEFGDYDFETPEALDLALINQHLQDLIQGKAVQVPRYDFKLGKRVAETDRFQLEPNQIILIDTLHGLYEPMTKGVPAENKFKLYIETLCQLKDQNKNFVRWTDIRLLRRMARDQRQRAYNPRMTIEHWHYVRRSELKHIIPYIPTVDYIVNGSLCYELPVLKKYLYHHFPEFVRLYENDSAHQDAYIRAKRVLELLSTIDTLENDDVLVPKNSLLREFIGGSCYTYHV